VAAFTAWWATVKHGGITRVGQQAGGIIVLPGPFTQRKVLVSKIEINISVIEQGVKGISNRVNSYDFMMSNIFIK